MKPTEMDQLFVNVARKIEVGGYTAKSEIRLWGISKAITELWTKKAHLLTGLVKQWLLESC